MCSDKYVNVFMLSFDEQKFLILMKSKLSLFSFTIHALCVLFQYVIWNSSRHIVHSVSQTLGLFLRC